VLIINVKYNIHYVIINILYVKKILHLE
jgi:hypothetical protein